MSSERANGAFGDVAAMHVRRDTLQGGLPPSVMTRLNSALHSLSMMRCSTLWPRCRRRCTLDLKSGMRYLSLRERNEARRMVLELQWYATVMY